ncbi:putative outer membrane starch-binding protein [Ulvibacter antarcticus]|uniref:Putative outer membrane starch-binding protein n=2 Tax=Ulvibacter antarcticus TaxID=442714 RepID=A0A3L9YB04_9FLAO|nr:putative outer membrane starch-binding protein [Ulvibacter antarcticus]
MLVVLAGTIVSCDKQLDQLPFDGLATDNAFVSVDDFENGIRGVYIALVRVGRDGSTSTGYYGASDAGALLSAPDVMSDNVTMAISGRTSKSTIHNFRYSPSQSNLGNLYRDAYSLIYRANQVLFFAETFEGENKTNIVAEAKALRAMAHFDLVKNFGKIPTQSGDANGSLGVAYVTEADPNITPERETVGAVYGKIVTDLTDAVAGINVTNDPGRLNRNAVNLLLSRVYLYMGQWQNSIDAANAVTTSVAARANVVNVWDDSSQDGLIFSIPNEASVLNAGVGVTWSQGPLSGTFLPEYAVSFELFNTYSADDIRKAAYITFGTDSNGKDYNAIRKLLGKTGQTNGVVDIKIFRAAEAKLNKAEALFNLGSEVPARNALDEVRSRRYTAPPSGETGTALRDAIRLERRLEFAFEYQRFYDLKRWGLPIERTNAGDEADGTGVPSEILTLSAGSTKFQLPIDQGIIDSNNNIVQNPGY